MRVWDQVDPRLLTTEQATTELSDVLALQRTLNDSLFPPPVSADEEVSRFANNRELLLLRREMLIVALRARGETPIVEQRISDLRDHPELMEAFALWAGLAASDAINGADPGADRNVTQLLFRAAISNLGWPPTDLEETPWSATAV